MKLSTTAMIVALTACPTISFAGWFSRSETVQLIPNLSIPQQLNDSMYVRATGTSPNLLGFCNDSFLNAIGRKVIGASNQTMLLLTYDGAPLLTAKYEQDGRNCKKEYILSSNLTGYLLLEKLNKEHKLILSYATNEKVISLQNAVDTFKYLSASTNVAAAIIAKPAAKELTSIIDNAIASSASTTDNQTITFLLPDNDGKSKISLSAQIGSERFYLGDIYLTKKNSLLEDKNADRIMNLQLDSNTTVISQLKERRTKEGINYTAGNFSTIQNECASLKLNYSEKLNSYDVQRLLEAYLLEQHRRFLSPRTLELCLGHSLRDPQRELTFKAIADELAPPTETVDTYFVKYLNPAEYDTLAPPNIKVNDIDTNLRVKTIADYVSLQNVTPPNCHTAVSSNRVGFVQTIGSQPYYITATVDKFYTKSEANNGLKPKITSMSISSNPDIDYTSIPKVTQCVSEWKQSLNSKGSWFSSVDFLQY